jgi:hypothetical protein
MALKRINTGSKENKGSNVDFEALPPGEYEGRLVYIADLGLQSRDFKGDEKPPCQQISLGIEICGQSVTIDGVETPKLLWTKPFNIFAKLNEKGREYEYFKVFNPKAEDNTVADWDSFMGSPCSVYITNREGKGEYLGKVFEEISQVTPIPVKYREGVPEARITPCIGDAEDSNNEATKAMYGLTKYVHAKRLADVPF